MRVSPLALVLLGSVVTMTAQAPVATRPFVSIFEGEYRAGLEAVDVPYATGGPWASIPSRAITEDTPPTAREFKIRTWREGESARVIVFAAWPRPDALVLRRDGTDMETQIASIALAPGESQEIASTKKYNARPVTISVFAGR